MYGRRGTSAVVVGGVARDGEEILVICDLPSGEPQAVRVSAGVATFKIPATASACYLAGAHWASLPFMVGTSEPVTFVVTPQPPGVWFLVFMAILLCGRFLPRCARVAPLPVLQTPPRKFKFVRSPLLLSTNGSRRFS